jgi:hypothetical protein
VTVAPAEQHADETAKQASLLDAHRHGHRAVVAFPHVVSANGGQPEETIVRAAAN